MSDVRKEIRKILFQLGHDMFAMFISDEGVKTNNFMKLTKEAEDSIVKIHEKNTKAY